jgi:enediyne biosynthesis protein E4
MTKHNEVPKGQAAARTVALIAIGIAIGIAAYAFLRQRGPQARPAAGVASKGQQPVVDSSTPPAIPFTDIAADSGITFVPYGGATGEKMLPESGGSGCAWFDYDEDGDPDLLLISGQPWPWDEGSAGRSVNSLALYRNDDGHFTNVTTEAGLAADFYGQGVAVGDYDGDGDDDLFITAVGTNHLFRNERGKFVDATAAAGVGGQQDDWTTSAGFFDYDRDGDLDLFVCNYVRWTRAVDQAATRRVPGTGVTYAHPANFQGTQNYLYRNDGGRFRDVSAEAGIQVTDEANGEPLGKALAVTFCDFDGDGWLDIFVANDTVRHFLFRNRGDGTFEDVGSERGFGLNALGVTTSGMGVDTAWIDNDDRLAVAIGNFAEEMTELYVSQLSGGEVFFTDDAVATGVAGPTRDSLTFGLLFDDMDLDGRADLVHANGHLEPTIQTAQPNQSYQQSAQLFWNAGPNAPHIFVSEPNSNVGDLAKPAVGRGMASADIDGDGDLDLVITQVDAPPLVLRNEQRSENHWLRCRLEGEAGNPHAIGSLVELRAGGSTQRRVVMPTRSYLSQSEPAVTFGLGPTESIESLLVTWPDGSVQKVAVDSVDREIKIRREATAKPASDPESFAALTNTAKAQFENGEFEKAIDTLKQSLAMRPDSAPTRRNLARAYLLGGQADAALNELARLPQQAQASAEIAYLRGLAAIRQSKYEDAAKYFRHSVDLEPSEVAPHFQLGLALAALGRNDEARAEFEETVKLDPLHGGAQYQLAVYARKAGDQQSFQKYMRDFQRIRQIKGPVDALAYEECRYTKPEIAETQPPSVEQKLIPAARFAPVEAAGRSSTLVAAAVLAMNDAGQYQLAGVTADGHVQIFDFDESEQFHEIAHSDQALGDVGENAVVLVGNAVVDAQPQPSQQSEEGDWPEIAIVTPKQTWLVRYTPTHGVEDLTASAQLSAAKGDTARWADLDHDGDIDLCTTSAGGLTVWRNNGDGSFVDATAEFGLNNAGACADFAAVDLDGVNLGVDLAMVDHSGSAFQRNQFGGRFAKDPSVSASWPAAERLLADDFTGDGLPDFLFCSPSQATLARGDSSDQQTISIDLERIDAVTTMDVDNDGWLDAVISGRVGDAPKTLLLRNAGGRFADAAETLPVTATPSRSGLIDVDVNADGRTDLVLIGGDGSQAVLRNETETENRQLKLSLRSFAGHPSSIGVRVQLRREDFAVTRYTQRELPIEIGVGPHKMLDSIQTLWPNGVARNEIGVAVSLKPVRISIAEFVRTSSCPFLYAWTDGQWQFVTDLLGTAPLNVSVARGVPMPPDPDEVVVLGPAERLVDDGAVRLRITSELREATYLDEVRLLAVDHPVGTTVFSRDRAAMTGVPGKQVAVGRDPIRIHSAVGSDGVRRTEELAVADNVLAEPGELLPPPSLGFTKPLSIEFDFGELPDTDNLLLVLTGWFRFGDSSTNIASSQRPGMEVIWPRLEVAGEDGRWQLVDEMVGFPTGNTKSIVCDLAGKLPADAKRFRLTTSFEVRWDQFALYRSVPASEFRMTEIEPTTANLAWHGFAELRPSSFDQPQVPNPAHITDVPPWLTTVEGWCTRYGDIVLLVTASDDRLAILNSGDGATIAFATQSLPPLEPGRIRTLLVYDHGWIKEDDPNSLPDRQIEPFPGSDAAPTEDGDDWQLLYNTRWVPRDRFGDGSRSQPGGMP